MENQERFAAASLELHLFFARIMKEHSLFLEAAFTPRDTAFAKEAEYYKNEFETILSHAVNLSDGIVGKNVLCSGEIVTEFTACAEKQTQQLTGININEHITFMETQLCSGEKSFITKELVRSVRQLNHAALQQLNGLIELKETILRNVLSCQMFTVNYPLLIEHILREANLYRTCLIQLENEQVFDCQTLNEIELFWNQIMMEHAMFIRGLLDPTETDLIQMSNDFANEYSQLLAKNREADNLILSLEETLKFKDFKTAGVTGIESCKIRSIILPLLADHVLREANHYIRLLQDRRPVPY